jgi:hypothetical protein
MSKTTMASLGYTESMREEDEDSVPAGDGTPGVKRYYGKYRGNVLGTPDPDQRGRLYVQVVDRDGPNFTGWARPCFPWGGTSVGLYAVPPSGSKVWVEFEQGHPDHALWTGCWYGSTTEAPTIAKQLVPGQAVFALESQSQKLQFVITDTPLAPYLPSGGILIGTATSCIAIDSTGVRLFGPTVQFNGTPDGSAVAAAALVVTK